MKLVIALILSMTLTLKANALCGIAPIPPIPPIGTSHCDAVCVCDETGMNCRWEFICR